jgi:hypothetical protein
MSSPDIVRAPYGSEQLVFSIGISGPGRGKSWRASENIQVDASLETKIPYVTVILHEKERRRAIRKYLGEREGK